MAKTEPLLGRRVSFSEAYPNVKSIDVRVTETGDFPTGLPEHMHMLQYDAHTIPERVSCRNPLCKNGGFDLSQDVYFMVTQKITSKDFSQHCKGHEKKGKDKGPMCSNSFKVAITISYK